MDPDPGSALKLNGSGSKLVYALVYNRLEQKVFLQFLIDILLLGSRSDPGSQHVPDPMYLYPHPKH